MPRNPVLFQYEIYNPTDDPQDAEVARMYKYDKKMFEYTAKTWTENFAKEVTQEDKIKQLMEMGFDAQICKEALERYDWDINLATNVLLGGWTPLLRIESYM